MKITYQPDLKRDRFFKKLKDIATQNCETCPTCKHHQILRCGNKDKIVDRFKKTKRTYRISIYTCPHCCTEWESEPYLCDCEINRKLYDNGLIKKFVTIDID